MTTHRWSASHPAMTGTSLAYAAGSHVGRVRSLNEDSFFAGPPVFVVADGMGGHDQGDRASAIVVDALAALADRSSVAPADLDACIQRARSEIVSLAARGAAGGAAPGSTVMVAALVEQSGRAYWLTAHEGDSRAYIWKDGELRQITRDHSLVQELVDAGELDQDEARFHPERHVVTRALGGFVDSAPDFCLEPVEPGARLLLCTDGLNGELSALSIGRILGEASQPDVAVQHLLAAAVEAGGHDNVTVLVVDAEQEPGHATVESVNPTRWAARGPARQGTLREDTLREDTIRIPRRVP